MEKERQGSRKTPLRSNPLLWDQTHSDRPILISSQRWPWPSYQPITHFSETHHLSVLFHWGPCLQHMKPWGTNHSRWRLIWVFWLQQRDTYYSFFWCLCPCRIIFTCFSLLPGLISSSGILHTVSPWVHITASAIPYANDTAEHRPCITSLRLSLPASYVFNLNSFSCLQFLP